MPAFLVVLLTVTFLIFVNGLYVAAEFSTVAARKTRISQMAASDNRLAKALYRIVDNSERLDRYVAACQLGITASSLVLGAYGQRVVAPMVVGPMTAVLSAMAPLLRPLGIEPTAFAGSAALSLTATIVLLLLTVLQVILGELFPKSLSIQYPEQIALAVVTPMRWSMAAFRPFIWLFNGSGNVVLRLLGRAGAEGHPVHAHSPEEIEILVAESHEGGLLNRDERQMLRNAFRLRDLTAQQVMIHRTRIVAAPVESTVEDLLRLMIEHGFSRIPIYKSNIDNILGFIHIKDLYRFHIEGRQNLLEIMRSVMRVPETMSLTDVWATLQNRRQYLAIVFDEYGGTAGLITFEDVIEEIFGELQDEFDSERAVMSQTNGRIHLRGDVLVADVNEYFNLSLPEDLAVTLSGLIISKLGRAPEVGDCVDLDGTELCVEALEDLGVAVVSLPLLPLEEMTDVREWDYGEFDE